MSRSGGIGVTDITEWLAHIRLHSVPDSSLVIVVSRHTRLLVRPVKEHYRRLMTNKPVEFRGFQSTQIYNTFMN